MTLRIAQQITWIMILTGILFVACTAPQATPPPQIVSREPFSLRMQGEEGIMLELSGNARGHMPGGQSSFDLRLINQGQVNWNGEYCLQLVDRVGVITTFHQSDFNLQPGEALTNPLRVVMPAEVEEGAYGLGLAVTDRWTNTTTIYLGEPTRQSAGPFAEPACP